MHFHNRNSDPIHLDDPIFSSLRYSLLILFITNYYQPENFHATRRLSFFFTPAYSYIYILRRGFYVFHGGRIARAGCKHQQGEMRPGRTLKNSFLPANDVNLVNFTVPWTVDEK